MLFHALQHGAEALLPTRLEQVVERLHFERAQRVLVMRRDEDDGRRAIEQREHFEAVELRHLDVDEEDIGIVLRHGANGFESVRAFGDDLEFFVGSEVLAQHVARERLVVDDDRTDQALTAGISISTRYRPLSSAVRSDARPSEIAASLPRAFCNPMLSPCGCGRSGSAGLSMRMCRRPSRALAAMSIVPPSTSDAMPCRTAFSTSGCSRSGGTRQFVARSSTSIRSEE